MTDRLLLDPSLDTAAAAALRHELLARIGAGRPLLLDGSGVKRVGQACLQVLVAARAAAREEGLAFDVADASGPLAEMAATAGLGVVLAPAA